MAEEMNPPHQPSRLTSLQPSIYEHVEEYGRTYHAYKDGIVCVPPVLTYPRLLTALEYVLPNDEVHISNS